MFNSLNKIIDSGAQIKLLINKTEIGNFVSENAKVISYLGFKIILKNLGNNISQNRIRLLRPKVH